jgi:hypothetical protein
VFAYKIFTIEKCRQIRKITHFECFCILQLSEVTSHSLTVIPRLVLKTQPEVVNYNISHFNQPPLGPLVALILWSSRDQREPGSLL